MLEIFTDDTTTPIHKQMSLYEYNAEEPNLLKYDLSACYQATDSKNYAFLVPGRFRDIVSGNLKQFKLFVIMSIQAVIQVSPLRIAHLDVQEAGSNVLVTFDLLDKAPYKGDVANPTVEITLQQAYTALDNAVNSGNLPILTAVYPKSVLVNAKPAGPQYQVGTSSSQTSSSSSSSSSGFGGGAMGGIAIGMLVLGALLGFVVMFLVYRMKGGTFSGGMGMQRFDNDKEEVAPSSN